MTRIERRVKCVVWDLDNTLWQGVLVEGDALLLRPGVRQIIEALDARGILQSIASRNPFEPAWDRIVGYGLNDYFLHPQIRWGSKADSIKSIATELGIAFEALAFIDDQAYERDEVEHFLPGVMTIDAAVIDTLLDMPEMKAGFLTAESTHRRKMYQEDIRRNQLESEFRGSKEEFLETLGMCLTIRLANQNDLRRAEELTVRTHQLNTTGRPYSHDELTLLLQSSEHLVFVSELEDRYGSSGIIGLALIEQRPGAWVIKLLIVSCRVIARGIGGVFMSYILQRAKHAGAKVLAEYAETDRNRMTYVSYKFNGFLEVKKCDDVIILEHDGESFRPFPSYLTIRSPHERVLEKIVDRERESTPWLE